MEQESFWKRYDDLLDRREELRGQIDKVTREIDKMLVELQAQMEKH
jgi:hypothetical protein